MKAYTDQELQEMNRHLFQARRVASRLGMQSVLRKVDEARQPVIDEIAERAAQVLTHQNQSRS